MNASDESFERPGFIRHLPAKSHRPRFQVLGGVLQPLLQNDEDLAALDSLELKFWTALAIPCAGVQFDARTLALLDSDHDQRIRPPEILAAVRWIRSVLSNPSLIFEPGDAIPLAAIRDASLLSTAQRVLADLGKCDAKTITLNDIADRRKILAGARFNGDGVIPVETVERPDEREAVEEIMRLMGVVVDRGGAPGVNRDQVVKFFADAEAFLRWADRPAADRSIAPLGPETTAAAVTAWSRVRQKIEDYFLRCRLTKWDPAAAMALKASDSDYRALATEDLTRHTERLRTLPLAVPQADRPLPLQPEWLNPAWAEPMEQFYRLAVRPLLAEREALTEAEWREIVSRLTPWERWQAEKPVTPVEALGLERIRTLVSSDLKHRLLKWLEKDQEAAVEYDRLEAIEKLVRFRRDLRTLLFNSVSFQAFYRRSTDVMFEAGTLYLDGRACRLCVEVTDPAKHAAMAGFSGGFLVYCDLSRPGGAHKRIVAVLTNGDGDNIMAGRNGVFYDRQGQDWDAVVTRVVANPISIREAFWMPYKRLIRLIEEQFAKRAQAADTAVAARVGGSVSPAASKPAAPPTPHKIDLGTIALIGTAIGGISALMGGLLQALFGLGYWLPLGLAGLLLLISGPSMVLASLKLRRRNLGPLLDAEGWAINTRAHLGIRLGAALTELAVPPFSSVARLADPFAERKKVRVFFWVALAVALGVHLLYWGWRLAVRWGVWGR